MLKAWRVSSARADGLYDHGLSLRILRNLILLCFLERERWSDKILARLELVTTGMYGIVQGGLGGGV